MYSLNTVLVACLVAVIAGLVVGVIVNQRRGSSGKVQRQLENQLSDLQKQQKNYQNEVTEHFQQTARLLDQLSNSYRDVHNHLASGAQLLADNTVGESLQMLPDTTSKNQVLESAPITPPLDYAPKSTPYDKGMLNEEFGFEKNTRDSLKDKKKTG